MLKQIDRNAIRCRLIKQLTKYLLINRVSGKKKVTEYLKNFEILYD